MKHYVDSELYKILNMLSELIILLACYFLSGALRVYIGHGFVSFFAFRDVITFFWFMAAVCIAIVALYAFMGCYQSVHFKSIKREFEIILVCTAFGGSIGAALLYFFSGQQFSRLLLVMFIVVAVVAIFAKRIVADRLAYWYWRKHAAPHRVLLIGHGENAVRYYKGMMNEPSPFFEFAGYVSEEPVKNIEPYLGKTNDLTQILQNHMVDRVIIAEEELVRDRLQSVLTICGMYGIRVQLIPVYSDYIANFQMVESYGDLHMIPLSALNTNNILGVNIAVTSMTKTMHTIIENLENWRGKYICVSNVHTTIMAHDDEDYRKVQNEAVMSLPDGGPLSAYSRSVGSNEAKRVTGPDLMQEVLKQSGEYGWRHFFYGSTEETIARLKEVVHEKYPGAVVAGMISPPFREISPEEDAHYVEVINQAKPDFVWVGLGAPKQEIWMAAHKGRINALMIGVGAAFDYECGNIDRAPKWMQKLSLEWLYRLLQDPKRLFKRYFVTNLKYLWLTRNR